MLLRLGLTPEGDLVMGDGFYCTLTDLVRLAPPASESRCS